LYLGGIVIIDLKRAREESKVPSSRWNHMNLRTVGVLGIEGIFLIQIGLLRIIGVQENGSFLILIRIGR
jgi:hypothetical protein